MILDPQASAARQLPANFLGVFDDDLRSELGPQGLLPSSAQLSSIAVEAVWYLDLAQPSIREVAQSLILGQEPRHSADGEVQNAWIAAVPVALDVQPPWVSQSRARAVTLRQLPQVLAPGSGCEATSASTLAIVVEEHVLASLRAVHPEAQADPRLGTQRHREVVPPEERGRREVVRRLLDLRHTLVVQIRHLVHARRRKGLEVRLHGGRACEEELIGIQAEDPGATKRRGQGHRQLRVQHLPRRDVRPQQGLQLPEGGARGPLLLQQRLPADPHEHPLPRELARG
mmetsp:Transcript_87810/g.223496  ORF Transcript_87810/g.223496 Transcript_87810/m.223496 type:complete len:286 (-) Transcript_87810:349-1206(-)